MSTERATEELLKRIPTLNTAELEQLVRHHNAKYWDENSPEIADTAFDELVETLRSANPSSPILQELGATLDRRFASVQHAQKMLSLDKCYDDETFEKWFAKFEGGVTVTPKIDGIACSIRYGVDGTMLLAATRGDGRTGDNISQNVKNLAAIPNSIPAGNAEIEVRGEVYMPLSRFREAYAQDFANPRNLTAGALKHKDPEQTATYGLAFFAYDLIGSANTTETQKAAELRRLGFTPPPLDTLDETEEILAKFQHLTRERMNFDYELDGVVMKVDDVATQSKMGLTAHHPRYAIAYKFKSMGAETTLEDVIWSVARTGAITPVAKVAPVLLSGVTVQRASLHNLRLFRELGLTKGATVEVVRRGDVIPHIEGVLSPGTEELAPPSVCPSCSGETIVRNDFLYCKKPELCPTVVRSRLKHFLKAIDVNGFGEKHLTNLIEKKLVKGPADMFRLTQESLMSVDRLGEKSATKLLREVNAKRRLEMPTFLTALGIEEVGYTVAEIICEGFATFEELAAATEDELSELHGIGPSIASSVIFTLQNEAAAIADIRSEVQVVAQQKRVATGDAFAGKSVVFTGKLSSMSRKSAQEIVKDLGGTTPGSVSAKLDYLVIGDDGSPLLGDGKMSSKHVKADKLNASGAEIQIISETSFNTQVKR